ncbi:MAG: protein-glutamate O-methyltransferase CheR [Proteobacteria bacterium]|nr:protein-glutamate O-methyltransferase CheR [Pseudomonadota bacterium]MBU1612273.1 protein-glutamate O-methyltransferase CheR [Pseudomonadota bacterium]
MALFSKSMSLSKETKISEVEFKKLRDFVYEQCGIFVPDNRTYLMENRLANRLKELNLKSYEEYYHYLQYDPGKKQELNRLFEVITTNETSFYRNPPQIQVFQENVVRDLVTSLRKSGQKRLRIWSAGCSTGEEPYTIAVVLHEVIGAEISSWDIKITANDLSERVLTSARRGVYSDYALRTTPPELVSKYFDKDDKMFKVRPEVKRLVSFGQINLNDRLQLKRVERSQIVFCRNVIIYFDDDMKKRVISAYYDNLQPGGHLLIGHSESLHNISRVFKPIHHPGAIVYKKEE